MLHPRNPRKLLIGRKAQHGPDEAEAFRYPKNQNLFHLYQHCKHIDFQIRFRWSQNDMALWDNRCWHRVEPK